MKVFNTVIALVILLALGGVFYYLRQQPAPEPEGTIPKKKLFTFAPDDVEEFSIEIRGEPKATFRRRSAQAGNAGEQASAFASESWDILSPADIAADHLAIRDFVNELPKIECNPLSGEPPASLADYSLDQPQKTFQFKLKQGKVHTFSLGGTNPSGFARYGMLDSEAGIFLLDTTSTPSLEKTLFDLRDKRLLPIVMDKAERLELHFNFAGNAPGPEEAQKAKELGLPVQPSLIVMAKQPNGNWELAQPKVRTDYGTTNYFVTIIAGGLMQSVAEEQAQSLAPYGLDKPQLRLDAITPDGTYSLLVGNKKENDGLVLYYAKNSVWPQVFTINQSLYQQLKQDLDSYRNRFLFTFQAGQVRLLEVQGPAGELRIEKKGEDWFQLGEAQAKVNTSAVDVFLTAIHALRVQQYVEDQPGRYGAYGLNQPWMKVKLTFGPENQEETVLFGLHNKRFYAARQGEPSVYEMTAPAQQSLEAKLKDITAL